ncbi:alpha/beta hydrolase [Archangium violaceum]|uniref:alpha/beta fold hydrolase n=1 Tax=Archangium violaceum TaxID=83451 RepID=UPI002B29045F|nr:alpha/beta hydrolase [Archangium violaceum]
MKRLLASLVCGLSLSAAAQELPARFDCPAGGAPVHEAGYVQIGGIPQWVTFDGADCRKPAVLVIHGGPGNALSPYASALYGDWERDFMLVQWDQRGAGMTFVKTRPAEGDKLTLERMTQDGLEVAAFVTRRLGQPRVILFGSSWGSVLGVHMALARPSLFSAYVGTAQLVSRVEDGRASYEQTLAAARAAGDQKALAIVQQVGPPPWTDPRSFGALRRVTRQYERARTEPPRAEWWKLAPLYAPHAAAFDEADDWSYLQAVGMKGDGMLEGVDLPKLGTHFEMPVYLIQGTEDLVTPTSVTRRYFERITAPHKELIMVPRTGHDPNPPMLAAQYRVLKKLAAKR